jgi:hypothetical protein
MACNWRAMECTLALSALRTLMKTEPDWGSEMPLASWLLAEAGVLGDLADVELGQGAAHHDLGSDAGPWHVGGLGHERNGA